MSDRGQGYWANLLESSTIGSHPLSQLDLRAPDYWTNLGLLQSSAIGSHQLSQAESGVNHQNQGTLMPYPLGQANIRTSSHPQSAGPALVPNSPLQQNTRSYSPALEETADRSNESDSDKSVASLSQGDDLPGRNWSSQETLLLITCYSERRHKFMDINTKNKMIWDEISKELAARGHMRDSKACETKLKNLKRSYTSCCDHNKTTGNERRKCRYYDELHQLFGRDDNIRPLSLCSNLAGTVKRKNEGATGGESDGDADYESASALASEPDVAKPRKKKVAQKRKQQDDLVELFKEFSQDRKEEETKKMAELQGMHNERMALLNRFLNIFENSLNKK